MSVLVDTLSGRVPFDQLVVTDVVEANDNARAIATEYRLNGELVRRDVAVSLFRTPDPAGTEQGRL